MISALLAAMVGVLVVVAFLLVVVLFLLCRLLALWGAVGRSETRSHARRATTEAGPFSGGSGAVDASIHSTTKVVRR